MPKIEDIKGILFVTVFAFLATFTADTVIVKNLALSPLIIGIVLGMLYANSIKRFMPSSLKSGIIYSTKNILRIAIVFYGFRLTFQNIAQVGIEGVVMSLTMVSSTFIIGYIVGIKFLKLDPDTAILTSAGSSICGAAAVLATEPVLDAKPHKSAVAVSTVVLFGTISMFLYPYLYKSGFLNLDNQSMGLFIGGTVHEVAHVVGAGNAVNEEVAKSAVIVKMIRVMLIAPFLIILGFLLSRLKDNRRTKNRVTVPWFAVLFILVAGFNSLEIIPKDIVKDINFADTFALTMAMSALGMETTKEKFKGVGLKPIYLALVLFLWLVLGGYQITKLISSF